MTSVPPTTPATDGHDPHPFEDLRHAALGTGITRGGVTFFPVYLPTIVPTPFTTTIRTGDRADLVIEEAERESVPSVHVTNTGGEPALLVEGETIRGGLQQRTINTTILIPAGRTVEVPVSCVESGRWSGERSFSKGPSFAPPRVRAPKQESVADDVESFGTRRSDQHAVWSGVDDALTSLGISSRTRNVADADRLFEVDRDRRRDLRDLKRRGPLPGQVGVVVMHGRRPVAVELFATPGLLAEHWTAVVRSHLLDATDPPEGRPSLDRALRFLRRVREARQVTVPGVGLGTEHHLRSERVSGQALTWEGSILHASAFALAA